MALGLQKEKKKLLKTRADAFYRLNQGEFIVFADGKDKKAQSIQPNIKRLLPPYKNINQKDLEKNFIRIHSDIKSIFN